MADVNFYPTGRSPVEYANAVGNELSGRGLPENVMERQMMQQKIAESQNALRMQQISQQAWQAAGGDMNKYLQIIGRQSPELAMKVIKFQKEQADALKPQILEKSGQVLRTGPGGQVFAEDIPNYKPPIQTKGPVLKAFGGRMNQYDAETGQWMDLGPVGGGGGGGTGKPPSGYRFTSDGELEAIPGGPADVKMQKQMEGDTVALQQTIGALDDLERAAAELKAHPGLRGITGIRGAVFNIPGSAAADAEAKLTTLKSQVFLGAFQAMKNASRNGSSGMGALSDIEGKKLESSKAPLDKAQSYDAMQSSLQQIIDKTNATKRTLTDFYNKQYRTSTPTNAPASSGGGKSIEERLKKYPRR